MDKIKWTALLLVLLSAGLLILQQSKVGDSGQIASDNVLVTTYLEADQRWRDRLEEISAGPGTYEEKDPQLEVVRQQRPDAEPAVSAAIRLTQSDASLDDKTRAADFLIYRAQGAEHRDEAILKGMKAMAKLDADYSEWQKALLLADIYMPPGFNTTLDAFFEEFDTYVSQPNARAAARYHAAMRRMMLANRGDEAVEVRAAHRARALELAQGLSVGVENDTLMRRQPPDQKGERQPYPTFSVAEKELLFLLNAVTLGQPLPNVEQPAIEGHTDSLAAYRGRTVLLDFWATWCSPCIDALPTLDTLKAELPDEKFEIISINTDAELETLSRFLNERPMPWVHWYVGEYSPWLQQWSIRGFPTYMLVDGEGVLVAKQHGINDEFLTLVRDTACRGTSGVC